MMNNKGFAVSSIIYGILIIFLLLVFSTLSVVVTRGNTLYKVRDNALNAIKGIDDTIATMDALIADFNTLNITNEASNYVTVDYNLNVYSPYDYTITNNISGNKITYTAYKGTQSVMSLERNINTSAEILETTYEYSGNQEKVMLNPGLHKIEVWGASGSTGSGGYSVGYLYLRDRLIAYINIGGEKKGSRLSYNDSVTHISTKSDLYSSFNNDKSDIVIAAGGNGGEGYVDYPLLTNKYTFCSRCAVNTTTCSNSSATSDCTKEGNGYIKISSLIYYTK